MGGCRCSYKKCVRTTKNSEKNFHFFHFPYRDEGRCLKWIKYAQRPDFIYLPKDQLRNKVVCQLHFETACFTNANQNRLIHSAVPTIDAGSEVDEKDIVLQVVQSDFEENVFTVDTNLLQNKIEDVQSYVIQNGNLVKSEFAPVTEDLKMYTICEAPIEEEVEFVSVESIDLAFKSSEIVTEPQITHAHIVEISNVNKRPTRDVEESCNNADQNQKRSSGVVEGSCNNSDKNKNDVIEPPLIEATATSPVLVKKPMVKVKRRGKIEIDKLSRTIQKHSKEIARLKRIVKRKGTKCKNARRNANIMNNLDGLIPKSLHAALSLHLYKKCTNFTKDEKKFLKTVYNSSPLLYEKLRGEKWHLPDVTTLKKSIL